MVNRGATIPGQRRWHNESSQVSDPSGIQADCRNRTSVDLSIAVEVCRSAPQYDPERVVIPSIGRLRQIRTAGGDCFLLVADLMSGCGMRNGDVYRITEQVKRTTRQYERLKHRRPGEYRDVPLPRCRGGSAAAGEGIRAAADAVGDRADLRLAHAAPPSGAGLRRPPAEGESDDPHVAVDRVG
jgi:hypothetical protein